MMNRVIIESPFKGRNECEEDSNIIYAKACMQDSLSRGEAPFASHLLYTQEGILNDSIPDQRKQGIEAGHAWLKVADYAAFYIDRGISEGMRAALIACNVLGIRFEFRKIHND